MGLNHAELFVDLKTLGMLFVIKEARFHNNIIIRANSQKQFNTQIRVLGICSTNFEYLLAG